MLSLKSVVNGTVIKGKNDDQISLNIMVKSPSLTVVSSFAEQGKLFGVIFCFEICH